MEEIQRQYVCFFFVGWFLQLSCCIMCFPKTVVRLAFEHEEVHPEDARLMKISAADTMQCLSGTANRAMAGPNELHDAL